MTTPLDRRRFLQRTATVGFGLSFLRALFPGLLAGRPKTSVKGKVPVILCSRGADWGPRVLSPGWAILSRGGSLLDAVEAAAQVVELDPEDTSVGYGGLPNEEGEVELDASIMYGPTHRPGAVAALKSIKTPSSVARKVMERSDHILIVGEGALRFAMAHGFKKEELLTEKARLEWLNWKETMSTEDDWLPPQPTGSHSGEEWSHGTINILAADAQGNMAGLTTTSGLAFKIPGRVGDSPIIGAGLYVDNDVGAAGATGRGEEVIRTCGSYRVVENMRRGMTPTEACEEACRFIVKVNKGKIDFNDKFVALSREGVLGCAAIRGSRERPPWVSIHHADGFQVFAGKYLMELP